jgi:8-oxo-dGTP pyrophosphatase MutT (NUDIX family)
VGTVAAIRPAATVVVARPAAGPGGGSPGVEVLALRRSPASRFAPGFVVFPGGVVEDGDADLARRWFGREGEVARACALRELAEEAGLVMTAHGLVEAPGRLPGAEGLPPPAAEAVPEMARWIAPEFLPVRFDARFFAIAAPAGVEPRPDGVEVDAGWWAPPQDLLGAHLAGDAPLMWPTLKTLEALAGCGSVDDVLGLRVRQVPPPRGPLPPNMAL